MPRFLLRGASLPPWQIYRELTSSKMEKGGAGCGSRRQGPHSRLSALAKHSSCQSIAMLLILDAKGVGRGQRGASTRGYWFLCFVLRAPPIRTVSSCPRQTRELVRSSSERRLSVNPVPVLNVRTNFSGDFAGRRENDGEWRRERGDLLFFWHHSKGH